MSTIQHFKTQKSQIYPLRRNEVHRDVIFRVSVLVVCSNCHRNEFELPKGDLFRSTRALHLTFMFMSAWVFEGRLCPTLLNEIKKTKLQIYTEPQAGINILLVVVFTSASFLDKTKLVQLKITAQLHKVPVPLFCRSCFVYLYLTIFPHLSPIEKHED